MANTLNPAEWNVSQQDYDTLDFLHSGSSLSALVNDGLQTVGNMIDPNIFFCQCTEPRTQNPLTVTYWNFGFSMGSVILDPTPSIEDIAKLFSDIYVMSNTSRLLGYSVWGWFSGATTYQEPQSYGSVPALNVVSAVFGELENRARWYPTQSTVDFNDPYAGQFPYLKINRTKICAVIYVDCIKGFEDCTSFETYDAFIDRVYVHTVTLKEWETNYRNTYPVIIRAYMPIYLGENDNRSQQEVSWFSDRNYNVEKVCNTFSLTAAPSAGGEWVKTHRPQLNTDIEPRGYMFQIMLFEGFRCTHDGAQATLTICGMTRGIFKYSNVNRAVYKVGSSWHPAAVCWFAGTPEDIRNAARRIRLPIAETVAKARYGNVTTDPDIELPLSNPDGSYKGYTNDPDDKADELDEDLRKPDFNPEEIEENPDVTEGDPEDPDDPDYDPEKDPEEENEVKDIPMNNPNLGTVGVFNRCYAVNADELQDLADFLWNVDLETYEIILKGLRMMGQNPFNAVISIFMYPFEVANTGSTEYIRIGTVDTEVNGLPINFTSVKVFDLGTCYFWAKHKNYLDYEPYTTAELYIPYVGVIQISVKEFLKKYLTVKMVVDLLTGVGQVVVYAKDPGVSGDGIPVIYRNCTIGAQISVTGQDSTLIAGNYIKAMAELVGGAGGLASGIANASGIASLTQSTSYTHSKGLAMGVDMLSLSDRYNTTDTTKTNFNPINANSIISPVSSIAQGAIDLYTAQHVPIESSGSNSPQCGFFMPQKCYLIVNRPIPMDLQNYGHLVGYACYDSGVIANFAGYSQFVNVVLNITVATDVEKREILTLLQNGVYV